MQRRNWPCFRSEYNRRHTVRFFHIHTLNVILTIIYWIRWRSSLWGRALRLLLTDILIYGMEVWRCAQQVPASNFGRAVKYSFSHEKTTRWCKNYHVRYLQKEIYRLDNRVPLFYQIRLPCVPFVNFEFPDFEYMHNALSRKNAILYAARW